MSPSKSKRPTSRQGGPGTKRGPGPEEIRRLGLLVFGTVFVLLFVIFAVAEGIGSPSIPSGSIAVVKGLPSDAAAPFDKPFVNCKGKKVTQDLSVVTNEEFECAFLQVAAAAGLKKAPKPGEKQYEELRDTTVGSILETIWIQGLAAEEGLSVTAAEVQKELKKLKAQNFKTEADFKKFLKQSHYTTQDVNERVKIQILSTQIQEKLGEGAGEPSKSQIKDYYEEAKSEQFTTPPTRDVRILIAKTTKEANAALAILKKDNSEKGWKKAVKKYSESGAPNGGLQPGVTEEQYSPPVGPAIFKAPIGKVEGPMKYASSGHLIFQVEKTNPEKVKPLGEAEAQIKSQLSQQEQEELFGRFVTGFQSLWKSRTFCAGGFTVEKCSNFKSSSRPAEADPACYEANPKKAPEACPAPVFANKPARPGSVSLITPKGEQLAQRPRPAGLEENAQAGVPSIEGLPPGVTGTPGSP